MQGLKLKIIQVWILNELYITKLWEEVITLDFSSEGLHFKFSLSTNFQRFDVNICNFQIKKHQKNLEYRNKQKRVNHFTTLYIQNVMATVAYLENQKITWSLKKPTDLARNVSEKYFVIGEFFFFSIFFPKLEKILTYRWLEWLNSFQFFICVK